jgi:hypothetical protein
MNVAARQAFLFLSASASASSVMSYVEPSGAERLRLCAGIAARGF